MLADNTPTLLDYIKDIIFFLLYTLYMLLIVAIGVFYIYSMQYALHSMIIDPKLPWWSWLVASLQVYLAYKSIKIIRPGFRFWVIVFIFAVINMAMVAVYNPAGFDIKVRIPPGTFRF